MLLIFTPKVVFGDVAIICKPTTTEDQCKQWMLDHDVDQEFIDLIPYIYNRCAEVGVDPTLVVSQSALETAYFTSGVLRTYHNTAGIKDRSNANRYAYYETYKDGFNAQICHLALYAGNPQEEYYYSSRLDGWVTTVEGLAGTWAEDLYYANKLKNIMANIQHYEVEEQTIEEPIDESVIETPNVVEEKEPVRIIHDICTLHGAVKVDTSTNMIATDACPAENVTTIY